MGNITKEGLTNAFTDVGKLKSALELRGDVLGDLAFDLATSPYNGPDALDVTKENLDELELRYGVEEDFLEEIKDMQNDMDPEKAEEIGRECADESEDIDEAVVCMMDKGIPKVVAVGLGENVAHYAKKEIEAASALEF